MTEPFTTLNWPEATQEQCDKANAAYKIAAETYLKDISPFDKRLADRQQALAEIIGFYFQDEFTAGEIADWALAK